MMQINMRISYRIMMHALWLSCLYGVPYAQAEVEHMQEMQERAGTIERCEDECDPCGNPCKNVITLFKADLSVEGNTPECRIGQDDRNALGCFDFITAFGANDYYCTPIEFGGIEITPGIPGVQSNSYFSHSVPPAGYDGPVAEGGFDRAKFLAYSYYAPAPVKGGELCFKVLAAGKQLNVQNHPFGGAVVDPDDDLRLASVLIGMIDPGTSVACNFVLTNKWIYALVERLPLSDACFGAYASYSYAIPLLKREPCFDPLEEIHRFKLCYNRCKGTVLWKIDGKPVFKITKIGHRLSYKNAFTFSKNGKKKPLKNATRYLLADHGGDDQDVEPVGFMCGVGLMTFLDFYLPHNDAGTPNQALVRLDSDEFRQVSPPILNYNDPILGGAATFVQDCPLDMSGLQHTACIPTSYRLFGQGAALRLYGYKISIENIK